MTARQPQGNEPQRPAAIDPRLLEIADKIPPELTADEIEEACYKEYIRKLRRQRRARQRYLMDAADRWGGDG